MTEELKDIGLNIGHRRVGRLMRLTRPEAQFDVRWLVLGQDHRIQLGSGRLLCNGTPVDLPDKPKPHSTRRGKDPVMDKYRPQSAALNCKRMA